MEIVVIRTLQTNYSYLIVAPAAKTAVCVDPGEIEPVRKALLARGVRLTHILCTHHHDDHIGAAVPLREEFGAKIVAAEGEDRIPADIRLRDGAGLDLPVGVVRALATPGHTRGSICYRIGKALFSGDTLFAMGCGRLFEGDAVTMFVSLGRIADLPEETAVYPGHEYAVNNGEFAHLVEPENRVISARLAAAKAGGQTVPFTLAEDVCTNPFLRARNPVRFAEIRRRKDAF